MPLLGDGGCYLLDFAPYRPPEECRVTESVVREKGKDWKIYSQSVEEFATKVHDKSGLDKNGTFLPKNIHPAHTVDPKTDMDSAKEEAIQVMSGAVDELLAKTGLTPKDIDILVTTCSIYCPTPSMASILVNHYKMKPEIQSYHLGGMGCGNGVMAVGLMKDLLKARPNSVALFVPAEITSSCFYAGKEKPRMVANIIFRMGGAAALFTNKPSLASRAKYELLHTVRVHTGADDSAYNCMGWGPDAEGINGVYLGKDVVHHAGKAMEMCVRAIAPKILTWKQYGEAAANMFNRRVLGRSEGEYLPDFTQCIDHFAIHAGGYAVLKGIQQGLRLPAAKMVPSFASLRDYGNTSCSTTWYVLGYLEECDNVKKGQTLMQIGMGGGMKAGINVWRALRDNRCHHTAWAHRAGKPYTEEDLPRSIEAIDGNSHLKMAAKEAAAAGGSVRYDDHGHVIPAAAANPKPANYSTDAQGMEVAAAFAAPGLAEEVPEAL